MVLYKDSPNIIHTSHTNVCFLFMGRKIGDKKRILLLAIMAASLFPVAGAATGIVGLWAAYELKDHDAKNRAKRYFKELEDANLIKRKHTTRYDCYIATESGKELARSLELKYPVTQQESSWDGVLRVIMFDINTKDNTKRRIFRRGIQYLDYVKIQQSVYANKSPRAPSATKLAESLDLKNEVIMFESTSSTLISAYEKARVGNRPPRPISDEKPES